VRRYLLKNNQGKLKAISEADLTQLITRGIIKYDTRLLNEETDLWSNAGSLPFFQKLIEKTHQKEVSALKDQISNVSIQFEEKFEKLNQKYRAINDEKEHYQFLTNQKEIQNKELMQEIQTLSLISANTLKSETFEKNKSRL
jgi:hypothetical protein